MTRKRTYTSIALGFAFALALLPGAAFASTDTHQSAAPAPITEEADVSSSQGEQTEITNLVSRFQVSVSGEIGTVGQMLAGAQPQELQEVDNSSKLLAYDPEAIAAIGTQEETGHSICCPSFSCAYADAVLDGTIHDHDYYTCSCCTWTDWGGGDSFDRCVGSDEELLREAYDQITAGRPTVIHVAWEGGEHWIALIGYENATDPNNLTLDNFIALDPWDGAQLNAGSKYSLYGDGCEHVSDR